MYGFDGCKTDLKLLFITQLIEHTISLSVAAAFILG